ncbi:MAG: hypothetical protein JMN27_06320 [gamma proteobacterium endosymbiont of Lamellibrachia anaximandri]|nr:hypothetical protein [gamma proteobacterium endosymbiont of Lamellibrachia anaximandri]MBL3533432.1 hypothetical protein [gamma proteobacterium endosymbiont of Lamellibrachia anaximandri]
MKKGTQYSLRGFAAVLGAITLLSQMSGCATDAQSIALGAAVVTAYAGRSPSNEIEQTYYLGVFDPQDQIPPTVYRVRVHGQASALSGVKFASGWVPAQVMDSLSTTSTFQKNGNRVTIDKTGESYTSFETGRRLMLFGPEGFREAPADHRLVIAMGSSPEAFFNAMNESLGVLAQVTQSQGSSELRNLLFEALITTRSQREQVDDLIADAKQDMPEAAK